VRPEQTRSVGELRVDIHHPASNVLDRGCNCRRGRVARAAPLLTDDLIVAARDRAREPELPEGTLARALSTQSRLVSRGTT
jgi:hypothetical protein